MNKRVRSVLIVLALSGLAVALALSLSWDSPAAEEGPAKVGGSASLEAPLPSSSSGQRKAVPGAQDPAAAAAPAATAVRPAGTWASATWGSGPDQLGRDRPQEGNPEAPMSLALDPAGNAVVLDQVNGRLVRYGKDGKVVGTVPLTVQGAQDLAFSKSGTAAVLDRLVDKSVALMGPDGKLRGELPVEGQGIEEGGGVTGVFVDGEDVYLEREHGELVRIGDTSGKADPTRPEVPGRPSRDGLSYLTAGLTDAPAGRVYVASIARDTLQHRFTRELRMGVVLHGLVLLDTDQSGVIYLGMMAELPSGTPEPPTRPALLLTCLDPLDGRPLGKVELPPNTSPEETFRELTVLDEGGVLYAQRSEQGVVLQRYECR